MCDCGCNTCDTKSTLMLNESLAPRDILSEGLKYHMDANKPLTEHLYRAGSENYFNLWAEARSLYTREILEITHEDDLAVLTETDLGHFGMFEGKKVPLDFPIEIDEAKFKGKTVQLNKPTRGDSKKFKVYVNSGKKNADGSIKVKKVNFGHGGSSAKKAGQKTMKIRKSNPKARSAFRARHNCSNPGPKTMARYWSCKKW